MTPYYDAEGVTIYHGRAEDVLPTLGVARVLATDLPYGEVNRESGGLRSLDKGDADDETFDLRWFIGEAVKHFSGSLYAFCGTEQVSPLRAGMVDAGLTTRLCIWEKSNPSPMNGERLWLSSIECCVFARKPKAVFTRRCESPVWRGPIAETNGHPTPKPEWLMRLILEASTMPGDLVIDPCMGSGATLRAAKDLGLRAIGIDKNERYCEMAANRQAQSVLFGASA